MITVTIDSRVKQVVSNIRNLPTPPIVFHQIQKVISSPNASATQVASILAEDPAMSVKVLKLTNSAFYGLSREIDSVKQAVVIVGMEAIRNLVLSASVLEMFKGKNVDEEYQEKFWRHSLATAFCSRILARAIKTRGIVDPDAAFSSGLLHDIGKIVVCGFLPDAYLKFNEERMKDRVAPNYEIEERILGYNHCQIGTLLTSQWKLPAKLIEAITFHHHPQQSTAADSMPYLVNLANSIAKKTFYKDEDAFLVGSPDKAVMEYLDISAHEMEAYGQMLHDEYLKAETFITLAGLN
ncbi:MAG: HDOD domain-containing protein [candidate division Zixibacteria bacterium]|nr:HDOD domain-containing protein [candidate division Zixibacteria bacterium]